MSYPHSVFPGQQAPVPNSADSAFGDDGFFPALFDLSFTKYITLRMVRVLYIIGLIVIALQWIASIVYAFTAPALINGFLQGFENEMSSSRSSYAHTEVEFSPVSAFVMIIVYTFFAFINVIFLRIFLEGAQAFVRAARSWRRIQERQEQGLVAF